MTIRSPLPWIGGKFYSAERIVAAFPHHSTYKTYCDVFGGAGHVLLRKPPHNHLEVYNDYCRDLVNFWMQCRNHPEELQAQIDSLPYARRLYGEWQESLFNGSPLDEMERAVRWFYVLRSSMGGEMRQGSKGHWGHKTKRSDFGDDQSSTMHKATALFEIISSRLHRVQIECNDFQKIIETYGKSYTFLYCDPPYIGAEFYYQGIPPFTMADHERLAHTLNTTPAKVALSYYPHEALDEWYPEARWRRATWTTYKHAEKTNTKRQTATEMLLMNYPAESATLWNDATTLANEIAAWEVPGGQDENEQVG